MAVNYIFETEGFEVFYPGVWTEREKPYLEAFFAENDALNQRKPFNIDDLIAGKLDNMIGYAGKWTVTPEEIETTANLYLPDCPLFHDGEYCRNHTDFDDLIAYPSLACHDESFHKTCDMKARDMLFVSDFNQSNTFLAPIYPGDTLYFVQDSRHVLDITPEEGAVYRSLGIRSAGTIYNQRGEVVNKVDWRMHEHFKTFKDGMPEGVRPWLEVEKPPVHIYTNEDYERFIDIWTHEYPRGDEVLFWEDVKVGDQPNPTLDGPIVYGTHPVFDRSKHCGMGEGGHLPLKAEIIDPIQRASLKRHPEYGFYYKTYTNPDGSEEKFAPNGMNFTKRDFAIKHLYNWMGWHGWVKNIRWTVLPGFTEKTPAFPRDPEDPKFLRDVPVVDSESITGFTQTHDIILVKSYVLEKTVVDKEHQIRLAWWVTGIDGDITFAGEATVILPSKNA